MGRSDGGLMGGREGGVREGQGQDGVSTAGTSGDEVVKR